MNYGIDKHGKLSLNDHEDAVYTSQNYYQLLSMLIREIYSIDDEIAIINNRISVIDTKLLSKIKVDEYNKEYYDYQQFREECKTKARKICNL